MYTDIPFRFTAKTWGYNIVYYRQYIASIAAAEKRPLSYQTPQIQCPQISKLCCSDPLPLTLHYERENWGKLVKE